MNGEHLKALERRFQEVVETATDSIILMEQDGNISGFNAAAERAFGWRRDEVLGKPVTLLMPEESRLRPVLHDQAHRSWHGPGLEHRPHCLGSRRGDHRRERAGEGGRVSRCSSSGPSRCRRAPNHPESRRAGAAGTDPHRRR
jgi:PAS domain-containing protein